MKNWKKVLLGDICQINMDSYNSKDAWNFVNYLDTGNIIANEIREIQYVDFNKIKLPSRAKRKVRYNSILYSTVRPNQLHYGIIKKQPENFLVSTGFIVIDVIDTVANADYIYFLLTQKDITERLQMIAEQSTSAYPAIKPKDLENIEIELPPLKLQERIAGILLTVDKKIKINNQINRNLGLAA